MWIAFGIGLILGAVLGFWIIALLTAGKDFYDNDGEF